MTRDMFTGRERGASPARGPAEPVSDLAPRHDHRDPRTRQIYYHGAGRSWTRDEILRLAGFQAAAQAQPADEIVVLFHTVDRPFTALIAIPRSGLTPARAGRSLATAPPFWRHGDIMHVAADRPP